MNIILQSELETLYSTKLVTEDPKKMTYPEIQIVQEIKEI